MDWFWDLSSYLAILATGAGLLALAIRLGLGWQARMAILAGTAAALGFAYVLDLQSDKRRIEAELSETKETLERERKQAAAEDKGTEAAEKVIVTVTKTVDRIVEVEREVANAPPEDDGPVAPVLKRALDGLRDPG